MIPLPPKAPRKRVETDIVREILVGVNAIAGVRAARNNVGTIEDVRGIPVTFGLGEGSPDIVGVISFGGVESTISSLRRMRPFAIAFGIEVKQPKRYATPKQKAWHAVARRRGFSTCVARSDHEAVDFVHKLRLELVASMRAIVAEMGDAPVALRVRA